MTNETTVNSNNNTKTKKSTRVTLKGSNIGGIPNDDILDEPTLISDPQDVVGEYTQELSDFTEVIDIQKMNTKTTLVSTWKRRIQPLIQSKQVRVYSLINFLLTILNIIAFVSTIIAFTYLLSEIVATKNIKKLSKPCIFQWSEWSPCSATCFDINKDQPLKTRKVIKDSIIHASDEYESCPSNIETLIDVAPCNTHSCPKKLSEFEFNKRNCYNCPLKSEFLNFCQKDWKCYTIRQIPENDTMIIIDTDIIVKKCSDCLKVNSEDNHQSNPKRSINKRNNIPIDEEDNDDDDNNELNKTDADAEMFKNIVKFDDDNIDELKNKQKYRVIEDEAF